MVQKRNIKFEIISSLMKKEQHLRRLASNLEESHTTVLRKLRELQEDNVVDYEEEGKNKVFFIKDNIVSRNYIIQSEIEKLNILVGKYPFIGVLTKEVLEKTNADLIILFGSYAKGNAKNTSDIDLYIETKNKEIKKEIESINSKINVKIGPFNKKSLLIKEIIKDHVVIKGYELFYEKIEDE